MSFWLVLQGKLFRGICNVSLTLLVEESGFLFFSFPPKFSPWTTDWLKESPVIPLSLNFSLNTRVIAIVQTVFPNTIKCSSVICSVMTPCRNSRFLYASSVLRTRTQTNGGFGSAPSSVLCLSLKGHSLLNLHLAGIFCRNASWQHLAALSQWRSCRVPASCVVRGQQPLVGSPKGKFAGGKRPQRDKSGRGQQGKHKPSWEQQGPLLEVDLWSLMGPLWPDQ